MFKKIILAALIVGDGDRGVRRRARCGACAGQGGSVFRAARLGRRQHCVPAGGLPRRGASAAAL